MKTTLIKYKKLRARRGAALLVVLGVVMVVTVISFAFLTRSDGELAYGKNMQLRIQTDYLADSALEHARGLILNPQEISGDYWAGASGLQIASGNFYYDVAVSPNDSYSGSTKWCNYDISCQAYKLSGAERTAQSNLKATLRLDPCIAYWTNAASDGYITSVMTINGDVYCGDDLFVTGTVGGDVFCNYLGGTVTGQKKAISDMTLNFPGVEASDYISEYTTSTLGTTLSSVVLGPFEPPRVFHRAGDLEITGDTEITGMLIVDGDLYISGSGNSISAGKAMPAVYVTGDVFIEQGCSVDIEGLAVVDGTINVNTGAEDVNVLGAVFAGYGIVETAEDSSVTGKDAQVISEPVWDSTGGQVAGTAELDGTDDKFEEYSAEDYLNGLSAITVSCWVKSDVTNEDRDIFFSANPAGGDDNLGLRYDKSGAYGGGVSGIKASLRTTNGYMQIESSSTVQTMNWQHLAITWQSGQGLKLYINGVENTPRYDSGTKSGTVSGVSKFMMGCGAKNMYWDGKIDDMRIYDRVLDVNDIYPPSDAVVGRIAHWRFDEDGQREVVVTAAPAKTAIWYWATTGERKKWAQAAGAFYKSIRRN